MLICSGRGDEIVDSLHHFLELARTEVEAVDAGVDEQTTGEQLRSEVGGHGSVQPSAKTTAAARFPSWLRLTAKSLRRARLASSAAWPLEAQGAPPALVLADLDRSPGRQPVARPERLHRRFLRRKTRSEVTSAHLSLTGCAGELVVGEHATEVPVTEMRQSRLHLVDGDEIDADGEPGLVSVRRPACLALVHVAHVAALSA